jgi:hypothetical protein
MLTTELKFGSWLKEQIPTEPLHSHGNHISDDFRVLRGETQNQENGRDQCT